MTRYTRKLQLKTNEGSNEAAKDPANNEVSNEGSNEVAEDPANNAETPNKYTDQTENNAAAHYKTFLMSICVLVLILL